MTNRRNSGGIWLRDWSMVASNRTSRWARRASPALGRMGIIARRAATPTLRLFGAGRKPGPSMAIALPRNEPLVLRAKRRESAAAPLLTVQSDLPFEVDETPEPPRTAAPTATADAPMVLRPATAAAEPETPPAARVPQTVVARLSRAVQQVFRRPEPPVPAPAAETAPEPPAPAQQASATLAPAPPAVISSTPVEEPAPQSEAPTALLRDDDEFVAQASDQTPPPIARQPTPEAAGGGLLMTLRRVFNREPEPELSRPADAPTVARPTMSEAVPPAAAPVHSADAASVAEPRMPTPASSPAPVVAHSVSVEQAASPQSPVSGEAPRREASPMPEPTSEPPSSNIERRATPEARPQSGLLFTLRRLVRREAAAPAVEIARTVERPVALPASPGPLLSRSVETPTATAEAPGFDVDEEPVHAVEMDEGPSPAVTRPDGEPAGVPEMTLLRPMSVASEASERSGQPDADDEALDEALDLGGAETPAPVSVPIGRLPRILRFWRRPEAPRETHPGLNLTLARQAAPSPQPAVPGFVQRSTYNVETGRIETAEALPGDSFGSSRPPAVTPPIDGREPAQTVVHRAPRPAAVPNASRSESPLVYRARLPEAVTNAASSAGSAASSAASQGISTLEMPASMVEQARNLNGPVGVLNGGASLGVEASASASAAGPGAPGETAAATPGNGPSAAPTAAEADAGKQMTLETLARQVYDRLRMRLLVERERAGIGAQGISR